MYIYINMRNTAAQYGKMIKTIHFTGTALPKVA